MTFRTSKEGGEKAIEPDAYAELNIKAAQTGYVDLVDVEIFTGDEIVKKIIDGAHAAGVKVIASNHDFFKTPAKTRYHLSSPQDAGYECRYSKDCRYATEQKGCSDSSGCNRGNDNKLC